MNRSVLVLASAAALVVPVLTFAPSATADDGGRPFTVALTGAAERPGPGDPDGSGTARLSVNPGQAEVCYTLTVENVGLPATGAHIHVGDVESPGPVVVALAPPDATGTSSGCVTADRDLLRSILTDPDSFYVNVHTSAFPAGAVRGQLG
jgi:hypothetical protein